MKGDLEELRHELLNGTTIIEGCIKHIEVICKKMTNAIEKYEECLKDGKD